MAGALKRVESRVVTRGWMAFRQALARIGYGRGPRVLSAIRKRWVILRHPNAHIAFGPGVHLGPGFSLHIPQNGSFIAEEGVEFRRDFRAEVSGSGRITFGAHTVCTYSVLMQCTTSIDIGAHCTFGQSTVVADGQHRFRDITRPMLEQGYDFKPIKIGDHVMTTSKCSIFSSIGERTVLGANSVVSKDLPGFAIAVGAPARVIEELGNPGADA